MKSQRLFIGSYIDQKVFFSKSSLETNIPYPLRFVRDENIHLTWKFIGETELKPEKIIQALQAAPSWIKSLNLGSRS